MVPFRVESRSTAGGLEERRRGGGSDCQRAEERRRMTLGETAEERSVGLWGRRWSRGGAGKEERRRGIENEKEIKRQQ